MWIAGNTNTIYVRTNTKDNMDCKRKKQLYLKVFIQTLYVYLGSWLCIRNDWNAILCCFYKFHHFYDKEGKEKCLSLRFLWVHVGFVWVLALPMGHGSSFGNKNGDAITSNNHILWRTFRKREMCALNSHSEECLCTLKCMLSSFKKLDVYDWLFLSLSGQLEHL